MLRISSCSIRKAKRGPCSTWRVECDMLTGDLRVWVPGGTNAQAERLGRVALEAMKRRTT
jgi:hypothetical protein